MTPRDAADRSGDGSTDPGATGDEPGSSAAQAEGTDLADDSEAIFSVLGDETRLAILLELAQRVEPEQASQPVSFSELRRAVDVEDAGRFNYHLDKLTGTFVAKGEDGYRPTVAGLEVASAIHAGRFADASEHEPVEIGHECPTCERPLSVSYDNEVVLLTCTEDHQWFSFPVPAGAAAGRSTEELFDVTIQRAGVNIELARTGLCPRCWGRTSVELHAADGTFEEIGEDYPLAAVGCDRCWLAYNVPAPMLLARAPPVVAFYQYHGVRPEEAVFSERNVLEQCVTATFDPDGERLRVELSLDGDHLLVELDGNAAITSTDRE